MFSRLEFHGNALLKSEYFMFCEFDRVSLWNQNMIIALCNSTVQNVIHHLLFQIGETRRSQKRQLNDLDGLSSSLILSNVCEPTYNSVSHGFVGLLCTFFDEVHKILCNDLHNKGTFVRVVN